MADSEYTKFITKLTKRELEVIEAILSGALRYKSIASALNISVNTVKTHLRKIYQTVGVNNTEALASLFHGYSSNNTNFTQISPIKNNKSPQIGDRNQHVFAVILYNIKLKFVQQYLGGKKMQTLKALSKRTLVGISLVLVFALVIGFTAIKLVSGNSQTNMEFGVTAEPSPEGILLTFSNIPEDAIRMFIHFTTFTSDEIDSSHDVISSFADIRDSSFTKGAKNSVQLERIKQTGKVIFPFVQPGKEYTITTFVYNQYQHDLMLANDEKHLPVIAEIKFIPENGIYFNDDAVRLELINNNSSMSLLSEPEFSSELIFSKEKYTFGITIMVPEYGSIGVADFHYTEGLSNDGLTWAFEPNMTKTLKESKGMDILVNGKYYSAYGTVSANIIFDDIIWLVELAKTDEFNYSL